MEEHFISLIRGERRGLWAGAARGGLWLLSGPYGLAVRLRNAAYDRGWKKSQRAGVPVVSVGNLTTGGTGKTPCVEYIARRLREWECRVAILSRGYRCRSSTSETLVPREEGRNDEALVLEENLPDVPHLQGADRVALARIAEEELESEVLLLDDGFQHRRLQRQLDIVLVDATNPWGYGHLLPRGLLREPVSSLRRADVIVLTRCDQVEAAALQQIRRLVETAVPGAAMVESVYRATALRNSEHEEAGLETISGKPVMAFCGIGNPAAFRNTLTGIGAEVIAFRTFPDHHQYTREDIDDLRGWVRQQATLHKRPRLCNDTSEDACATECVVVTTQKDLVKIRLPRLGDRPLWALRAAMEITGGRELLDRKLKEVLA